MENIKETGREIKVFLGVLFSPLKDNYIEIRKLPSGKQSYYNSINDVMSDWNKIQAAAKKEDVYLGACARGQKRGRREDVGKVNALWVDMDGKSFHGGKNEALRALQDFKLKPSIIIDSGNGYHAYWQLKASFEIKGSADVERIEGCLKGLASHLNADSTATDLPRILRLPGTVNHKNGGEKPVKIIEVKPERQYDISDFDPYLSTCSGSSEPVKEIENGRLPLEELLEGEISHPNRHAGLIKIGAYLYPRCGETITKQILRVWNKTNQPPKPHFEKELEDLLRYWRQGIYKPFVETPKDILVPVSLNSFLQKKFPKERWLIDRLIPNEGIGIIAGKPEIGKSWVLIEMGIEISRGGSVFGKFKTKQGPVLYFDEDSPEPELHRRLQKLVKAKGLALTPLDLHLFIGQRMSLSSEKLIEQLSQQMELYRPSLVIIDCLVRVHSADENSAMEMAKVFNTAKSLAKKYQCFFLFADHLRKEGQFQTSPDQMVRGSTEKIAAADTVLTASDQSGLIKMTHTKSRSGVRVETFCVSREDVGPGETLLKYEGEAEALKKGTAKERAEVFLTSTLNHDTPISRKDLVAMGKAQGFSEHSLDDAIKNADYIERKEEKVTSGRGGKSHLYTLKSNISVTNNPFPSQPYIEGNGNETLGYQNTQGGFEQ